MSVFSNVEKVHSVTPQARPPGTVSEHDLGMLCSGCGDCLAVCPLGAISQDGAGFPVLLDAENCRACGLCADVCTRGAIELTAKTSVGLRMIKALESVTDYL